MHNEYGTRNLRCKPTPHSCANGGSSYSFKKSPFWVHPNAFQYGNNIIIVSTINSKEFYGEKNVYLDFYNSNLRYNKSIIIKNTSYSEISNMIIDRNNNLIIEINGARTIIKL